MSRFALRLFVLLTCISFTVKSQVPDLGKFKNDNNKIKVWLDYCAELRLNKNGATDNYVLLQKAGLRGLQLVKPANDSDQAKFSLYTALGYYYQVKFDSAQYYFYQSLHGAQAAQSARLTVDACAALIPLNIQLGQPDKVDSCKTILQSILDTTHNPKILQDGYFAMGSYYQHKSYYSTAQDYIIKSLELRKKELDTTHNNKLKADYAIQCYLLSKLYQNSEVLYPRSLAILKEGQPYAESSPAVSTRYLSSFTEIYTLLGNIDSALHYKSLLDERTKNSPVVPSELVSANINIAKYYIDHRLPGLAYPFVERADTLAAQSKSPILIYQAQLWNGRYLEEAGKFKEAIAQLSQSLPVARQINNEQYLEGLKYLAIAQKEEGDKDAAIQNYEQYISGLDSLEKETMSTNFADQETRYQTNEKQNQIVSLGQKNKLNVLELKQASNTKMLLILGLVSLGVFSLLLYFIYRNKEKLNMVLNERNKQLDELNNELSIANDTKAKLFGVISHDLRAPVSSIVQLLHLQKENPGHFSEAVRDQHNDRLNKASENVLETMEDLLLWSKSQMKNFTPQYKLVQILPLLSQETVLFEEQTREKDLHVILDVSAELRQQTDENFLAVIVRNLIQNAIKQSDVRATITISADADSITITNPAANKSAAELNAILEQTDVSSKRSGFGLQIVKDLATRLGIKIYYQASNTQSISAIISWI